MEKLFKISTPYGYHIPDVNKAIEDYNKVVTDLKDTIIAHQLKEKELNNEIQRLKDEVIALHSQLSMLEVPDQSSISEFMVMQQFMEQNGGIKRGLKVPFNPDGTPIEKSGIGEDIGEDAEEFEIDPNGTFDIDIDSNQKYGGDMVIEIPKTTEKGPSKSGVMSFDDLFIGPDKNEKGMILSDDEFKP